MLEINPTQKQVPWVGDNVQGHSIDSKTGEIDLTEGFGAFDSVLEIKSLGHRALDIGGGAYDANSAYVATRYLIDCDIYDPFQRTERHNAEVISKAELRPYDAVFSFSVLNVISSKDARLEHIQLCKKTLKLGGKAIFKVWPGDESRIGKETPSGYQSNCLMETYIDELKTVFGRQQVSFDKEQQLTCCLNYIDKSTKGSLSM